MTGLLGDFDLGRMQATHDDVISDHDTSIVIRRGPVELDAQTVRVCTGGGSVRRGETAEEQPGKAVVYGDLTFNVQAGDRFTHNLQLYRVTFVRPNQQTMVVADAEVVNVGVGT